METVHPDGDNKFSAQRLLLTIMFYSRDKSFPYIALKSNSSDPEGDDVIVNADEQENDFSRYSKSL